MVFGWGKKKEEKIPDELPKQKNIQLSEVRQITEDLINLRTTQTLAEIKLLSNRISPLIKELGQIGKTLEKDDLKVDEIDKHLRIIVVRGKKQVIEIIKKESIPLPEVSSLNDSIELSNVLNQRLKRIGDVLGRQTRVIHIFAKKYAEKLKEILAEMNSNNNEIKKLIKNYEDGRATSDQIINSLEELNQIQDEIILKNQRISELKDANKSTKETIKKTESAIEKIKSSQEYLEFEKLTGKLSSFESSKTKIKNDIESQFTKISRPLGRYEYISSLDKDQKSLLSQLINDPIEVLTPSKKDSIIVILENVRKGISSGSISVKDIEKTLSHITETEEFLDNFIDKVIRYNEKRKEIQNQISAFDNQDLLDLESALKKSMDKKLDLENKITVFQNDILTNTTLVPKKISEIEKSLKKFSNTHYSVVKPTEN